MKLFKIILSIFAVQFIFASPEQQLISLLKKTDNNNSKPYSSVSPMVLEYEKNQDQAVVRFANKLDKYINCDLSRKSDRRLFEAIQITQKFTPSDIAKKLSTEVRKGFYFKDGDLILSLRHSFQSWQLASLMDDAYTHSAILFIEGGEVFVLNLNINENFYITTLADYIKQDEVNLSRLAIFRPDEKKFDQKKFSDLLTSLRQNQENIFFDRLMIRDTSIRNPKDDFQTPCFFYCAELVFAVYEYVFGGTEFSSDQFASLRDGIINRKIGNNKEERALLRIAERIIEHKNQKVIAPKTFTASTFFKRILFIGGEGSVKNLSEKQKESLFLKT